MLEELQAAAGPTEIVVTKMALLASHVWTQKPPDDYDDFRGMQQTLLDAALEGHPPPPLGYPTQDKEGPNCFDVAVQPWRAWAGDARSIQSLRRKLLRSCQIEDQGMQQKIVLLRRESSTRLWQDEEGLLRHLKVFAEAIGASLVFASLGPLEACEQVRMVHDAMLLIGVHGTELVQMIFLPPRAAVVEIGVHCHEKSFFVEPFDWRGPGWLLNSTLFHQARRIHEKQRRAGMCPLRPTREDWLQGQPNSVPGLLARQANLLYTAIMDCHAASCFQGVLPTKTGHHHDCVRQERSVRYVQVDVQGRLLPVLMALYEGHLANLT